MFKECVLITFGGGEKGVTHDAVCVSAVGRRIRGIIIKYVIQRWGEEYGV